MPFNEDAGLQQFVVLLGVVVGFLQAQVDFLIVDAVGHDNSSAFGIHLEQFGGKIEAGVAVALAFLVEDKDPRDGVGCVLRLGQEVDAVVSVEFEVLVQGVVAEGEAVGQVLDLRNFGRKPAQRLDEAGVAVDFDVQVYHDAVVRRLVLGKFFKFIFDLLQGETEVERVFLFLRIEAQRKLVALFHDVHHPLVLKVVIACDFVLC